MAVMNNWRTLNAAWQDKLSEKAELIEEDERNRARAEEEIRSIKIRILRAKGKGEKRLENVRFIPRSICTMPIKARSWYEIHSSWVRNPEKMILTTLEAEKYQISFTEKFDPATQSFGFMVSISWE